MKHNESVLLKQFYPFRIPLYQSPVEYHVHIYIYIYKYIYICMYMIRVHPWCNTSCKIQSMVLHELPLGLHSLSGKTSYRKITWSLEAARFGFKLIQSLWNLAGTSAALLPRCLSNFRAIRPLQHPISRLRDFTRFGGKTSYRLVNRGPGRSTAKYKYIAESSVQERPNSFCMVAVSKYLHIAYNRKAWDIIKLK